MDPTSIRLPHGLIAARTTEIATAAMSASHFLRGPNFTVIAPSDLSRMFDHYDRTFFDGFVRREVGRTARGRLSFRLAPRMTRAGGKTFRIGRRSDLRYEIAISTRLLFLSFDDVARPTNVCGVLCTDRLSALQRIMEHEILHLLEFQLWNKSSCTAARFKSMARNIFAHGASTHDLVTPAERAKARHDLHIGQQVIFEFEGRQFQGMLNRINRRATVLVESPRGVQYTNGKRYEKFYIPLGMLKKTGALA